MSYLSKLMPAATRAVKSYYWLYLAGIVLPILQQQLPRLRTGDAWEIADAAIVLLIPAIAGTLAYVDQHENA